MKVFGGPSTSFGTFIEVNTSLGALHFTFTLHDFMGVFLSDA